MKNALSSTILLLFLMLCLSPLFSSCGHNMLTDYKVKGLDLSIPIMGYPFGIRLGETSMNFNVVRGNASYSSHANTGFDVSTATTSTTSVIQFSSNPQVNEGYVHDILTSEKVESDVKESFVKDYLGQQEAPNVLPVTLKSNQGATAAGNDPEIHKAEIPKHKNLLEMLSFGNFIQGMLAKMADWFLLSKAGQIIILLAQALAGLILFLFLIDILKKLWSLCKWCWKKIRRKHD